MSSGRKFERYLRKIPRHIELLALEKINAVRIALGAPALDRIPTKGADDHSPGTSTPLGLCLKGVLPPEFDDGSGYRGIEGIYDTVWAFDDGVLAGKVAAAWDTEPTMMCPLDYCCHRHSSDEECLVVPTPPAVRRYEKRVHWAADQANGYYD
jgi:hypothetical protein